MPTLLAPHFPHYVQMEPSKRPRRPPCRHQAKQLAFHTAHKPTFPLPLRSGHLRGGACKSPNVHPRSLLLRRGLAVSKGTRLFCVTHHKEPRERTSLLESELSSRDKRHWAPAAPDAAANANSPRFVAVNLRVLRGSWPMPCRAPLQASSLVGNVAPFDEEAMGTMPARRIHVGPKHARDGSRRCRRRHCWDSKRTSPPATSTGPPILRYGIHRVSTAERTPHRACRVQFPGGRPLIAHHRSSQMLDIGADPKEKENPGSIVNCCPAPTSHLFPSHLRRPFLTSLPVSHLHQGNGQLSPTGPSCLWAPISRVGERKLHQVQLAPKRASCCTRSEVLEGLVPKRRSFFWRSSRSRSPMHPFRAGQARERCLCAPDQLRSAAKPP
ncbi:hypothetical protein BDP81DRAFT_2789 [Colletotrichum phormii]|uniref:Uncharacterized protein n=1 Tax=Colletotrichum phormii TaxID=359342 RepID=A0AAJ0A2M8_9PEZI|nr:uncharacterized protein BDP81DRAFT_2789 [Colletotrichum phormii]KAK1655340.1 hypothetical protein BDP81DRAFT_2789 [Colletotrichum phormii]